MTLSDFYPVFLTLRVALASSTLTLFIGMLLAFILARKQFYGKEIFEAIITQPLVIPPTVLGYYLLAAIGKSSFIGRALEDSFGITLVFTWKAAVIAAVIASLPLFINPARAAIESVDKNLENAARLLGKSEIEVFYTITLPLAWRGVLAGIIMSFARSMGEFGATLMVAGNIPFKTQTAAIAIYDAVQGRNFELANNLVVTMTFFSVALLIIVNRITKEMK